jgi:hypothetical protein
VVRNLSLKELTEFKREDPTGYVEVGDECIEHFNAELKEV